MKRGRYTFYGLSLDVADDDGPADLGSAIDAFELQTALQIAQPGDRVLVAGGGLGATSLVLAGAIGRESVITYEANPYLANLARRNVRMHGEQLDFRFGALMAYTGEVGFHVTADSVQSSVKSELAHYAGTIASIRVPCFDVNEVLRAEHCTGMLLDVEGAEMGILPDLDVERLRFLVIELHGSLDEIEWAHDLIERAMTITTEHVKSGGLRVLGATKR